MIWRCTRCGFEADRMSKVVRHDRDHAPAEGQWEVVALDLGDLIIVEKTE